MFETVRALAFSIIHGFSLAWVPSFDTISLGRPGTHARFSRAILARLLYVSFATISDLLEVYSDVLRSGRVTLPCTDF